MPSIYTEVDIELEDIDTQDLVDELSRRGYIIVDKKSPIGIYGLYSSYLTSSKESFDKDLKKFFRDTLDVNIY